MLTLAPQAQALFKSLDISCKVNVHRATNDYATAYEALLASVGQYFRSAVHSSVTSRNFSKVELTELPPVYLQRPGHSLTIVGFESRTDGSSNLLVFDPTFDVSFFLKHYLKSDPECRKLRFIRPKVMLGPFRRGSRALRRFKAFETLSLAAVAC